MNDDKMKLIEKLQKLLALANGGTTEEEASSAMGKVQELLARHDLSMADLTPEQKTEESVTSQTFEDQRSRWVITLWQTSCLLNRCEYLTLATKTSFRHLVLGKPFQVLVAKSTAEYLEAGVRRIGKQAERETVRRPGDGFRKAFRLGCASRLYFRAKALVEERSKQEWTASTGERLPALRGLYEQAASEIQAYKASKGLVPKATKSKTTIRNSAAFAAGQRAAESISLEKQIEARRAGGLLS